MPKRILMLFQDCYDCGPDKEWYDEQVAVGKTVNLRIEPAPHDFPGIKELIIKAHKQGFDKLPVLTNGHRFSYDVREFTDKNRKSKK